MIWGNKAGDSSFFFLFLGSSLYNGIEATLTKAHIVKDDTGTNCFLHDIV